RTVKLDGELVDPIEGRLRQVQERLPFRAFDVHFDDQMPPAISVPVDLRLGGIEYASIRIGRSSAGDTFRVKHQRSAVTYRLLQIEAIVFVNLHVQLMGDVAAPP